MLFNNLNCDGDGQIGKAEVAFLDQWEMDMMAHHEPADEVGGDNDDDRSDGADYTGRSRNGDEVEWEDERGLKPPPLRGANLLTAVGWGDKLPLPCTSHMFSRDDLLTEPSKTLTSGGFSSTQFSTSWSCSDGARNTPRSVLPYAGGAPYRRPLRTRPVCNWSGARTGPISPRRMPPLVSVPPFLMSARGADAERAF